MYRIALIGPLSYDLRRSPWEAGRWRLIPVALKWCQKKFSTPTYATVLTRHGFRMKVDLSDWLGRHVYVSGEYEPATTRVFELLLKEGDTVVDVGANAGYFTLLAARCVGKHGRVIAFEPVSEVRQLLEDNVRINGLKNCSVRSEAASDVNGETDFYLGPRDHIGVSSLRQLDDSTTVERVTTIRLEEVLAAEPRAALVKIDIEGAECHAVEGLSSYLRGCQPDLIVEVTDSYLRAMGRNADELFQSLECHGYRAYLIGEKGLTSIAKIGGQMPAQFNAFFTVREMLPNGLVTDGCRDL